MKQVNTLNTVSGQVGLVPISYLTSPAFKDQLVEVPEGTKSYDPKFYKSTDAKGYAEKPVNKSRAEARLEAKDEEKATLAHDFE